MAVALTWPSLTRYPSSSPGIPGVPGRLAVLEMDSKRWALFEEVAVRRPPTFGPPVSATLALVKSVSWLRTLPQTKTKTTVRETETPPLQLHLQILQRLHCETAACPRRKSAIDQSRPVFRLESLKHTLRCGWSGLSSSSGPLANVPSFCRAT